jgi:pilus assembly protein CpaF
MFAKKLEDSSRKIMEITECEILPDGERKIHTLFRYNITENSISKGKVTINGDFERVNPISASLQKRLRENGMPLDALNRLVGGIAE